MKQVVRKKAAAKNSKHVDCFHCGKTFDENLEERTATANCCKTKTKVHSVECARDFSVVWDGNDYLVCSPECKKTADEIIRKGLGDFYRLPRPKVVSQTLPRPQAPLNAAQQKFYSAALSERECESYFYVPGLHCSSCAWVIERALQQLPGVINVGVNSLTRRVQVAYNIEKTELNKISETFTAIGYPAEPLVQSDIAKQRKVEQKTLLKQILVAGFGTMQAMMFALVIYVSGEGELDAASLSFFKWLGFLVATPVVLYSARPFFSGAKKALLNKNLNMDVPIAISVVLTYAASFYQAISQGGEVYFDSVSMLVFLILIGRYLELVSRQKAQQGLDRLGKKAKPFIKKQNQDGEVKLIKASELKSGDQIFIEKGEVLPVDAVLLSTEVEVDESMINGEFVPLPKKQGDKLLSGSVIYSESAQLTVINNLEHSFITALQSLSLKAQTTKASLVEEGEKTASQFVLAVLCFTFLTVCFWLVLDSSRAFDAALAVLVVSCPCAFALATPAVITRSLSVLAARGIMLIKPDALKRLLEIDTVMFDKTGTLTDAHVYLNEVWQGYNEQEIFRIVNSLSQYSDHPISEAFREGSVNQTLLSVENVQSLPGLGISGLINQQEFKLGRPDFVLDSPPASLADSLVLANEQGLVASFTLEESVRKEALRVVEELKNQGKSLVLSSGDNAARVAAVAHEMGFGSSWRAKQLPWQKMEHLEKLTAEGHKVMMLGDGNNDAPVLASAHVSVSFASASNLAQSQSDILLCANRQFPLIEIQDIAEQARHILKQNKQWAVAYNMLAIPFAAMGMVPPWLAAIGMSVSSLVVVLNAFRIGVHHPTQENTFEKEVQWA